MLGFTPTASLAGRGEKLGGDPWIGQPVCYELGREPFSLGAVSLSNAVNDFVKACHIRGLPAGSVRVAYVY
jgi:hypothetical protein